MALLTRRLQVLLDDKRFDQLEQLAQQRGTTVAALVRAALDRTLAEQDRLVRALAAKTGETISQAVATAVRERLVRVQGSEDEPDLIRTIELLAQRCAALPLLDDRPEDEILGYDEHGLPA